MIQNPTPENQEECILQRNRTDKIIIRKEKIAAKKEFVKSREEYRLNPRSFFRKYKSNKNGFKAQIMMIKDDKGHLLIDETSIVNRFKTHFHTLLNVTKEEFNEKNESYPIYYTAQSEVLAPNLKEIKDIIKILKNNKTPVQDNINAELIKIWIPEIMSRIHGIIKDIWENGPFSQE